MALSLSSSSSDMTFSIRTSCNRCRFQKLKCIVEPSDDPSARVCCQRCARAIAPCVFSRRNKPRLTAGGVNQKHCRIRSIASPTHDYQDAQTTDWSSVQGLGPSPMEREIMDQVLRDTTGMEDFCSGNSWPQELTQNLLAANTAPINTMELNEAAEYVAQGNSLMDDMLLFDNDINLAQCIGIPDVTDYNETCSLSALKSNADALPKPSEYSNTSGMLLKLASNFHERLEALENGPWKSKYNLQTLDKYPIGSVLHLSKEFTGIATEVRQRVKSGEETSSHVKKTTGHINVAEMPSKCFDVSLPLILLSCYVTLTKIYTIVFEHLYNDLKAQTGSSEHEKAPHATVDFGPAICLRELPLINPSYSRTHTAVCMLLESLGNAEDALGLPSSIRSNSGCATELKVFSDQVEDINLPVHWEILTGAMSIEEGLAALREKVKDVKNLLREKMKL